MTIDGAEAGEERRGGRQDARSPVSDALDVEFQRCGGAACLCVVEDAGEGVEDGEFEAVKLEGGGGAEVEVRAGAFGDGVDGAAAGDDAVVERGAGLCGEGKSAEFDEGGCKGHDRVGTACVGPGMSSGAGDAHAKSAAAESSIDDGCVSGTFERQGAADSAGVGRCIGEEVAHAAEVAFALFADVGGEDDGGYGFDTGLDEGGGDGKERGEARTVVAGTGAKDAGAVFAGATIGAGRKDGVEVGAEEYEIFCAGGAGGL